MFLEENFKRRMLELGGVLQENKLYPTSVENSILKKLGDSSEQVKNMIAIFGLFRQQKPFNQVGDINKIKSKEELKKLFDSWFESKVVELAKTKDFGDNKQTAITYLQSYVDNVRSLGNQAQPFSIKNVEKELIDLVNQKGWIKSGEKVIGGSIYNPDDDDILYQDEDIWIMKGDTKAKCVKYGAGKSWCITKPELNYYTTYRIHYGATIYFCMQPKVSGPEHTFVIMNYGDEGYAIADETNTGERHGGRDLAKSWSEIESELPNLKGKEKYFKYIPVTQQEENYSNLVSQEYDGNDLGEYVLQQTKDLVVNGGIITPADFIRDYVAHGNEIEDKQFDSLNDEMKDSLIEAGIQLNKEKFDTLTDSQQRRYVNIRIKNKLTVEDEIFLNLPDNLKNEYMKYISSGQVKDILIKKPELYNIFNLNQLYGLEIADVLEVQPQLHPHFYLSKLSGAGIAHVLKSQPQLHPLFDLSKLNGLDIAYVLQQQPQLHPLFDLSKLSGEGIAFVLRYQPQLHPHFELSKLDGYDIAHTLQLQPQLHPLFDLSKLDGAQIAGVLEYQPQLHPLFDLSKVIGADIAHVLRHQPQLKSVLKGDLQEIRRIVRNIILENLN